MKKVLGGWFPLIATIMMSITGFTVILIGVKVGGPYSILPVVGGTTMISSWLISYIRYIKRCRKSS